MAWDGGLSIGGVAVGETVKNAGKAVGDVLTQVTEPETKKQRGGREKEQTGFDYKYAQYPPDLDSQGTRHPYYITFYIATQDLSKFKRPKSKRTVPLSTVDINARATRTLAKSYKDTNIGFGRKTHRTVQAIRLFMPDTLSWNFSNQFNNASISGIPYLGLAQAVTSAPGLVDSLTEGYKKSGIRGILASLNSKEGRAAGGPAAEAAEKFFGVENGLLTSALGIAVNPQIDVIYQSPVLREFNFEFLFAPRSADEAHAVATIIHLFKFHSAPEILDAGLGRYFVPPSEFDIEFSVNTMGKISTCVLQDIALDYAPSGAAFYGKDNQPVNTRMTLRFRELEFITKELVDRGY